MKNNILKTLPVVLAGFLAACASGPEREAPRAEAIGPSADIGFAAPFPIPEELRPQVDFWRKVYATWSLGQVTLHDNRHLNLIYEIVELPGAVSGGYTAAQQSYLRERYDILKARLEALERKVQADEKLDQAQQSLADRIAASAGFQAVRGAAERVRAQRGLRERFKRGLEISGRYDGLFREIFRQAGLPEDLAYLPHVESSFQAHARSSAGAVGMWQFTRGAARTYMNNDPALDERRDPVASARGAARYLRHAYDTLQDWPLALTSYNHGIGGMQRASDQFGADFMRIVREYEDPYFGFASRNFYAEFLAAREVARQPERFFPEGLRYEAPLEWDSLVLATPVAAPDLARRYRVPFATLAAMNPAWTDAARRGRVRLPEGAEVWLPAGTLAQFDKSEGVLVLADKTMESPAGPDECSTPC